MRLDFDDLQVRSWGHSDVASLAGYANNRNVSINLRDAFPYPYTWEHAEAWVRFASRQQPETNFAIATEAEAIGGIGFRLGDDVFCGTAEVGYWLGEPFWGQGIATDALRAFTEYAFGHFDLVRIDANVYEWNPASARVLEKAGFEYEGCLRKSITKDGQTIDQWLYAMVRE